VTRASGKEFASFWALRDLTMSIPRGTIVGLIGRNGAGKTTLLSIIAGIVAETDGVVVVNGRVASLLNLGIGFQDELTGRENIYLNGSLLGMSNAEISDKFDAIVSFSELHDFIDVALGKYSQGMKLRLGFSVAAHLDFDIMLIDEVIMVGDGSFQKKCFEKLIAFQKAGKTLILTTQSLEVIERLSEHVLLLEQGRLVYYGDPAVAIEQYKQLMNEKSGVHLKGTTELITQTKWWVEPDEKWGTREGSREVVIERVSFTDRWGRSVRQLRPGQSLTVTLECIVTEPIYRPHVGIALFRDDGVYCFGPNTTFDNIRIDSLQKGKVKISLTYTSVLLMPAVYRFSVVIWDHKETLAYDYLKGYFTLTINGDNVSNQLVYMPPRKRGVFIGRRFVQDVSIPEELIAGEVKDATKCNQSSFSCTIITSNVNEAVAVLCTGEPWRLTVSASGAIAHTQRASLWVGIFRKDGIFCAGYVMQKAVLSDEHSLAFETCVLLPGDYTISVGVWDPVDNAFLLLQHNVQPFSVHSYYHEHGTVYLPHAWKVQSSRGVSI